jgi:hypothetical protein
MYRTGGLKPLLRIMADSNRHSVKPALRRMRIRIFDVDSPASRLLVSLP